MKCIKYIREIFNTKTYKWIKSENNFKKIATFEINNKKYFVNIDEIMTNVYNIYFYIDNNGNKIYDLIRTNDKTEFKILSNVKKCIEEFIENDDKIKKYIIFYKKMQIIFNYLHFFCLIQTLDY